MNLKQASNLASQSKLPNFLGLAVIMIFLLCPMIFLFILFSTDTLNQKLERVYLAKADAAVADDHPNKYRLMVNINHEVPYGKDCPELRYKNGILIQPCQIEEHWRIKIKGKELTRLELEQRLQVEGNLDREIRDDPKSWSNRPVMIRADGNAPCRLFRIIREACSKTRLWKMEIAVEMPPGY
ncbi:MAG: hypothetical protein HZA49_09725 [Planctomycetes bacterium]|nr:hypothetical protein [Planctomycetota bacterium]